MVHADHGTRSNALRVPLTTTPANNQSASRAYAPSTARACVLHPSRRQRTITITTKVSAPTQIEAARTWTAVSRAPHPGAAVAAWARRPSASTTAMSGIPAQRSRRAAARPPATANATISVNAARPARPSKSSCSERLLAPRHRLPCPRTSAARPKASGRVPVARPSGGALPLEGQRWLNDLAAMTGTVVTLTPRPTPPTRRSTPAPPSSARPVDRLPGSATDQPLRRSTTGSPRFRPAATRNIATSNYIA